jgi:hypothetical protein
MDMKKPNKIKRYTREQCEFLRTGYLTMNIRQLTIRFNKKFKLNKKETAIKSFLQNHKITCGRKVPNRLIERRKKKYFKEHIDFIKKNCVHGHKKLTELFNEKFKMNVSQEIVKGIMARYKINSGRTGYFCKGHKPWNTGTKGLVEPNSGNFKKGNVPANVKPLWSERICTKDGFILMKVPERNPYTGASTRYKHKHVWVWEQENGPVPKGYVIAFIDSDKTNCNIDNLMMRSQAEMLILNQLGYSEAPIKIKSSILALALMKAKMFERKKGR